MLLISAGLFIATWLGGCHSGPATATQFEGKYFHFLQEYPVSDSAKIELTPNPRDFKVAKDGSAYIATGFTNHLLRTRPPFSRFEQLGRLGLGPGEYVRPSHLAVYNDFLLYLDGSNALIKSITLDKSDKRSQWAFSIPVRMGARKFDVEGPYLAVLNNGSPYISLYALRNGKASLIEEFLRFDTFYRPVNGHMHGGNIKIDPDYRIYVVSTAPYVISVFQVLSGDSTTEPGDTTVSVEKVATYNLQKSSDLSVWTRQKYQKLTGMQAQRERLMYLSNACVQVHDFAFIESRHAKYLLVELMDPELLEQSKFLYHLVSLKDGTLVKIFESPLMLLDAGEDVVSFYDATESSVSIRTYRFIGD